MTVAARGQGGRAGGLRLMDQVVLGPGLAQVALQVSNTRLQIPACLSTEPTSAGVSPERRDRPARGAWPREAPPSHVLGARRLRSRPLGGWSEASGGRRAGSWAPGRQLAAQSRRDHAGSGLPPKTSARSGSGLPLPPHGQGCGRGAFPDPGFILRAQRTRSTPRSSFAFSQLPEPRPAGRGG